MGPKAMRRQGRADAAAALLSISPALRNLCIFSRMLCFSLWLVLMAIHRRLAVLKLPLLVMCKAGPTASSNPVKPAHGCWVSLRFHHACPVPVTQDLGYLKGPCHKQRPWQACSSGLKNVNTTGDKVRQGNFGGCSNARYR